MLPNPLFTVFGRGVYMYGICIAVGIISCIILLYSYTKKAGMPAKVQDFIFFIAIIGIGFGFFMAAVFQAFYNFLEDGVFTLKNGGMTVMGGLVGGAAAFLAFYFLIGKFYFKGKDKDLHKKHFNTLFRVAPICITIAHAFGRIGCLMAGCCHGKYLGQEYVVGGIWMKGVSNGWGYYVPTQLYESLFLFVLTAVLSILFFKRCNITMAIYLIAYGLWRIFIEFFRDDPRGAFVLGLAPSQWQSIIFIALGVGLIVFYLIKKKPMFLPKEPPAVVVAASDEVVSDITEKDHVDKIDATAKKEDKKDDETDSGK